MTSKLTREQAEDTIEGLEGLIGRGVRSVYLDMAITGMRQLMAAMDSEPVAWDYEWASHIACEGPQNFKRIIEREAPPEWAIEEGQARNIIPLYRHAQPAPVLPDEVTAEDCPAFVKYEVTEVDEAWSRGFHACRAAMLNGGKP